MKKIFIILLVAGIMLAGCAKRNIVVKPEETKIESSANTQKQPVETPGDRHKLPQETIALKELPRENIAEKQVSERQRLLKELQAKIRDIHFDFDQYEIRSDARPALKELAEILSKNKEIRVIIEGHCDEKGTIEYNVALGDRRSNSVKEYLKALGIPSSRIETLSYGKEKPLCTQSTEECWSKNRRAHFVVEAAH